MTSVLTYNVWNTLVHALEIASGISSRVASGATLDD